ncbi:MAG: sensor histidine kinase [Paenibacillus sp.]|uniref:cache domain-containing sensor histidine kinase n=1 Tax=Paenibacillus sp. TaxID=58172 RepID=UPI002911AF0B|nr:sensor histidine kinase [Paenibacillus sp.]MDU4696945.1 sensor histidine kinase [Paenibacillus sp.]
MHKWLATSLQRKLSVVVAGSMIVPMLALGIFAFVISSNITEEKTKLTGSDMLKQMDANLRFMLEDIETLSIFLIGERDLQAYLTGPEDDEAKRTELVGRMTNLAASKPYIANIAIYPERFEGRLSTATWYENELPAEAAKAFAGGGKTWSGVYAIRDYAGMEQVMTLFRPIRSIYDFRRLGWLAISLDEQELARNLESPEFGQGMGKVELVGVDGTILSSTDKSRLGRPLEDYAPGLLALIPGGVAAADDGDGLPNAASVNGNGSGSVIYGEGDEKSTVLYRREPLTDWMLVGRVPYDQYRAENRYILTLTAEVVGVSVLACTLLIWFTVRRITRPLRVLTRHLSRIDPERPLPRFPATSDDEIGRLGHSYNMLGAHIEQLKREVIRGEARKKEADLRALQAQINPHFLYNTLSSIHWIALMSGERRIADMVEGLSDFLRISLNQGRDYCPVEQEVAHIRNYVRVQSIRFPDKFAVEYIVDEGLLDKWMLKLLLQPLVENALIHGIQKRDGVGTITILIQPEGKRMNVMVMDDGLGMSAERLREVRQALALPGGEEAEAMPTATGMPGAALAEAAATRDPAVAPVTPSISSASATSGGSVASTASAASAASSAGLAAGYGLRNVNERLLLHYGREAGLTVDSREGEGTQVSFSIPIMEGSP